jgi:hypothetical protein
VDDEEAVARQVIGAESIRELVAEPEAEGW